MKPAGERIIDLDLPDAELAEQLGVSEAAVSKARRLLTAPTPSKQDPRFIGVDWSKTNVQIAEELQVSYPTVRFARLKYGGPSSYLRSRVFGAVDWSKSDAQIAAELGRPLRAVITARLRRDLPAVRTKAETAGFEEHGAVPGNIDWRLRDKHIAEIYGIKPYRVGTLRQKLSAPLHLFVSHKPTPESEQAKAAQKKIADAWFASKAAAVKQNTLPQSIKA